MDRRTPAHLALFALLVLPLVAGCGPTRPDPWRHPVLLVDFAGMNDTANVDAEMGLGEGGPVVELSGDLAPVGEVRLACGPAGSGPHPPLRLRLTGEGSELIVTLQAEDHGEGHDGQEAEVRLARLEGGELVESTGHGTLHLHPATHRAGRRSVSGTFEAELEGAAGSGAVSGRFASCYFFR